MTAPSPLESFYFCICTPFRLCFLFFIGLWASWHVHERILGWEGCVFLESWINLQHSLRVVEVFSVCSCYKTDSSKPETEVLKCLRLAVTKPIMSAVNQIMSMVYAWQAAEHHGTCQHRQMAPESLLNKIPKDWNYVPRELKRKESGKSRGCNIYEQWKSLMTVFISSFWYLIILNCNCPSLLLFIPVWTMF